MNVWKRIYCSIVMLMVMVVPVFSGTKISNAADSESEIRYGYGESDTGSGEVVTIPDGVTYINSSTFQNNSTITEIILPDSIKELPMNVFKNCTALKRVVLPSGLTELPSGMFWGCTSLENVTIPETVTKLGSGTFLDCHSLKSIQIPSAITELPFNIFENCTSLERIQLPSNLLTIENQAFENCTSLGQIDFPASLSKLGYSAFKGCSALKEVVVPSKVEIVWSGIFPETTKVTHDIDRSQINEIVFEDFSRNVVEGKKFQIESYFTRNNSDQEYFDSDKTYRDMFQWSSSDESIVRTGMGENPGEFLAMKPGTATLSLTVGTRVKQVTITVTDDKRVFYVIPELRYSEKVHLAETEGLVPQSERDVYQYVYDKVSVGNYNLAIYNTDAFDVESVLEEALAMYKYYIVTYNKPDRLTTEWKVDVRTDTVVSESDKANHYDWGNTYYVKDSTGKKAIIWTMYNPDAKKIVKKLNSESDRIIQKIMQKNMTEKQKMKAIHDYIIKHCDYDMKAKSKLKILEKTYYNKKKLDEYTHSAYGSLILKRAVCDGYAHGFDLLAHKAGITSVCVCGKGHAWNLVKINNKYRYIDTTYDDPVILRKANLRNPFAPAKNTICMKRYFLITSKKLRKDHYFYEQESEDAGMHTEQWYQQLYEKMP